MKVLSKHLTIIIFSLLFMFTLFSCNQGNNNQHSHSFEEGKCECGEVDPNYNPPHIHDVCPLCGRCLSEDCKEEKCSGCVSILDPNKKEVKIDDLTIGFFEKNQDFVISYAFNKNGIEYTVQTKENQYSNETWVNMDNFTNSSDIYEKIKKYDVNNKEEYIAPWVADGLTEEQVTLEQRTTYGRYKLEHNIIVEPITDAFKQLDTEMKGLNVFKEWADQAEGKTAQDYVEYKTTLTEDEYSDFYIEFEDLTFLDFLDEFDFTGTYEELVDIIKTGRSVSYIESSICEFIYDANDKKYFRWNFDEYVFASLIVLDSQLYKDICSFDYFDYDKYNEVVKNYNYYNELIEKANIHGSTLLTWETYYREVLLGFEGVETECVNGPLFTINTENNCILEFWFNTYSTAFKVIKKDQNGNIINKLQSNLTELEIENLNISEKEKENLKTIFNLFTVAVVNNSLSNYKYSVLESFDEYNYEPNFSINIDYDNKKVIVLYTIKDRGIDSSYFPRYISATKLNEYLERNKSLVEQGATSQNGKPITYIEDKYDSFGVNAFIRFKSYYKFIPAYNELYGKQVVNPDNQFGYDYYHFSPSRCSTTDDRNFLYYWLYEAFLYTEDDLLADNNEFGYKDKNTKFSFEIAIEYRLTSNGLEVIIPGNSIKEENEIFNQIILFPNYIID